MTRTYRRILFYTLVLVFLPLAGWLVLLAQGFTIKGSALVEHGAIFLRGSPAGATVYLNGNSHDSPAGFFRTQAFIKNLRPGTHHVLLTRGGYHHWEKTFSVAPLTVTEASTIRLFPRAPQIERVSYEELMAITSATTTEALMLQEEKRRQLSESASSALLELGLTPEPVGQELILSPDRKKVLVSSPNELLVIWLEKELVNGMHPKGRGEQIFAAPTGTKITDAVWLPNDSYHVIFAVGKINPNTNSNGGIGMSMARGEADFVSDQDTITASERIGVVVKIAELDSRGGRNVVDLMEAENVRFFLATGSGSILFINGSDLFRLAL